MINDAANFQISNRGQNGVTSAIRAASAKTGVDFGYLVKQAHVESSMNPNAKARTSSATGLYQFIDQTWLREMKTHGAEHGYGKYADAIKQNKDGDYYVPNAATKRQILNLRKDPQAASLMAAELATENNAYLRENTGITPGSTDLYMAHFLGAQGASNFLNSMKKNPWAPAASFFPEAARSNKGVFYAQGRPLSLQQVYNNFDAKFKGNGVAPVQTASAFNPDIGDQGPSVVLPAAIKWNNPDDETQLRAQEMVMRAGAGDIRTLTAEASPDEEIQAPTPVRSTARQALRWPGQSLFMAQAQAMQYAHDDQKRYNT